MKQTGLLRKMKLAYRSDQPISYKLVVDEALIDLNAYLGEEVQLHFQGEIFCTHCGRKTSKSFNQGYCFPCARSLARCDICIVKPELCHFAKNTCREPEWGLANCMIPHTIYLANSSGIKVGITRSHQQMTRWMDQGAVEALPIAQVDSRLLAGRLEVSLKGTLADKTNWRTMLKGDIPPVDLIAAREKAWTAFPSDITLRRIQQEPIKFDYPVLTYPTKITSFNLDKAALIKGRLQGLKGQYLIFDTGVINIRKYGGYKIHFEA